MYIVEGNIGVGKSTFLQLITQQLPDIRVVLEPLTTWQDTSYGKGLLTNFYNNPQRWAYTLELLTMMCRVQDHTREQQNQSHVTLVERSIYSGYYCFAHNSYKQGFMTELEWSMYQHWCSRIMLCRCLPPRGFIYLRVTPEIAFERVKIRNRDAEKTLSLTYLKQIHQGHEALLIEKEGILPQLKRVPVLVLDCSTDFVHDKKQLHHHIHALRSFLIQTGSELPPYKRQHTHHVTSSSTSNKGS